MKETINSGVFENLSHFLQMVQNVRGVGHAQSQPGDNIIDLKEAVPLPAALWDNLHQFPEKFRQRGANVSAIRPSILTGQPDLTHTLIKALLCPSNNLFRGVAAQLASCVTGLAVSALVQAACVDCNDFRQNVGGTLFDTTTYT